MTDWHPIDSAPKEGEDFLVAFSTGYISVGRVTAGRFFSADSFGPSSVRATPYPTHWALLPEPPVQS